MRLPLASALALTALAGPALAQSYAYGPSATAPSATAVREAPPAAAGVVPATITPQVVRALRSPSAEVRAGALHAVVTLAYSAEGVDLRPATPALLAVFQTDADEAHRVLALRALETSGSERVMGALRREAGREPLRVRHPMVQRLLFSVLVAHYGADDLRGDADVVALAESLRADRDR